MTKSRRMVGAKSAADLMTPPQGLEGFTPRHSSDYLSSSHKLLFTAESAPVLVKSEMSQKDLHRNRHLSEAEISLAEDVRKTQEAMRLVDDTDEKLWHLQPVSALSKQLETDAQKGLSLAEAERRLAKYGPNRLAEEEKTPIVILYILQFANIIIMLLLFAAVASLIFQEWVEGIAIFIIININAIIATYQERSAANALGALASMSTPHCVVIREGSQKEVASEELVPGDIVILVTGDVVPADCRLIQSSDFKVNEMILTGETEDVPKSADWKSEASGKEKLTQGNMVFGTTTVSAGNAVGIVVVTGMNTRVGSIAALLSGEKTDETPKKCSNPLDKYKPKMTPLQKALEKLGILMGAAAIVICLIVWVVGYIRENQNPDHSGPPVWLHMLMISVSLAVSAVPEGLPVVVTICLSKNASDMVKRNVLVRKLAAVETLGSASVICTDKTGTLTEGKMTATKLWGADPLAYEVSGQGFDPEGDITVDGASQIRGGHVNVQLQTLLTLSVLCSNTRLQQEVDDKGVVRWLPFGNTTEAPLIVAAAKAGIWEEYITDDYPRKLEIPFTSTRKMMITLHSTPDETLGSLSLPSGCVLTAAVKGAPNYIVENCVSFLKRDGSISELTSEVAASIMEQVDELSSQALRVIAVAFRPLAEAPFAEDCDDSDEKFTALKESLVFAGLVASIDPERAGVKDSIETARGAGVRTVMITGDYLKTAIAIAKNINLLQITSDPAEEATDCSILRPKGEYLPEPDLDSITSRTLVFARAKPEDKIEIVKSLQRQGWVSAMTGDGVNDAPALKEADIGIAMGISGTEVAKGASDMILTDDNFVSIVSAIEKGRVIYSNIQKFVTFLLSTNVGEILMIFVAIAFGLPVPLQPLQILILNLFSDGMPAMALSMEKGDESLMHERPRPKDQHIIHGRLWLLVFANAFLIFTSGIVVYTLTLWWSTGYLLERDILQAAQTPSSCKVFDGSDWSLALNDPDCGDVGIAKARTTVFIELCVAEIFRAYTVRSFDEHVFKGVFNNGYMQLAAVSSFTLMMIVTTVPWINTEIFGFEYISGFLWITAIVGALNTAFWGEMLKWVLRRMRSHSRRWQNVEDNFDEVLLEIRNIRYHIEALEGNIAAKNT